MTTIRRAGNGRPTVYLVDDHDERADLRALVTHLDCDLREFDSAEAFLAAYRPRTMECLLLTLHGPASDGLELLERLRYQDSRLPVIVVAKRGTVPMAVRAMRAGAVGFVERPFVPVVLAREIRRVLR